MEQIEAALRAADAAGNQEDARALAAAYKAAKGASAPASPAPKTYTDSPDENYSHEGRSQPPSVRQALENAFAGGFAEKMGGVTRDVAVGVRKGARDMMDALDKEVVAGVASPVPSDHPVARQARAYVSPESVEANKAYDAAGPAAGVGRVVPELALTAVPVAGAGARLSSAARTVLPKALHALTPAAGDIAANAAYAAATAAPGEAADAATYGAAGAAGGRLLTRTLGGLARPFLSKDAQTLLESGVRPTPGQLFGEGPIGSAVRSVEDKLTSFPLVGEVINYGRRRSLAEYGNAEINAALSPLGAKVSGAGAEAVEQASQKIGAAYDRVLPQVFIDPVKAAKASEPSVFKDVPLLDDAQAATVSKYVLSRISPVLREAHSRGASVSGETAKAIDAEIGHFARKFTGSVNPSDHPLGEAFYALQSSLRGALEGRTPEATRMLTATNDAYRRMLPVLKAAVRQSRGEFTPRQIAQTSGQYNQRPSELNRAGQNVLPSRVPDSGTASRALMTGAAIGAGGLPAIGAAGIAGALYSGPGMSLLVNGLRGVVPDTIIKQIAALPPAGQRTALEHLAAQLPAVSDRLRELVPQVARTLATQEAANAEQ
ncbi:hypothetical protein J7E49_21505 [Variovorax paradoxus]|nr:hypothetical protein [Variovorax paradoxus]